MVTTRCSGFLTRFGQKACHSCESRNDRKKLEHRVISEMFFRYWQYSRNNVFLYLDCKSEQGIRIIPIEIKKGYGYDAVTEIKIRIMAMPAHAVSSLPKLTDCFSNASIKSFEKQIPSLPSQTKVMSSPPRMMGNAADSGSSERIRSAKILFLRLRKTIFRTPEKTPENPLTPKSTVLRMMGRWGTGVTPARATMGTAP
ncbi:Uncharacterized protein dnm_095840 [Desulfonema magnum]|uniref:Uncharacterized protein n=1 Tax=Desulfonema magnum TaxID=45655 RepID=A0A975BY73_9BACT|nr:Uncharacterized protein dnm_095840 [Desulfonema magnum]